MTNNDPKLVKTRHLELPASMPKEPTPRATGPLDRALPWVIEFRVVGTSSILQTQVYETMLLGRADSERDINPEIDLSPYNAGALGVSRRHAVIVVKDTHLWLKDMGSTNGTRLNESVLEPLKEYRLHHGDELMLGQLHMQLQYSVVPAEVIAKPSSQPFPSDVTIAKRGKGQHVLIIEDDDNTGEIFKAAIERTGYEVTLVKTVIQGLGVIFNEMPDAVILDVMLSDMNALDLVRYVRKQNPKRIPVVVLSGGSGGFFRGQAYEAGADVFMNKPVTVEDMIKQLSANMIAK